jgi:hypothetical protein
MYARKKKEKRKNEEKKTNRKTNVLTAHQPSSSQVIQLADGASVLHAQHH